MSKLMSILAIAMTLGLFSSAGLANELTGPDEMNDPSLPVYDINQ